MPKSSIFFRSLPVGTKSCRGLQASWSPRQLHLHVYDCHYARHQTQILQIFNRPTMYSRCKSVLLELVSVELLSHTASKFKLQATLRIRGHSAICSLCCLLVQMSQSFKLLVRFIIGLVIHAALNLEPLIIKIRQRSFIKHCY